MFKKRLFTWAQNSEESIPPISISAYKDIKTILC